MHRKCGGSQNPVISIEKTHLLLRRVISPRPRAVARLRDRGDDLEVKAATAHEALHRGHAGHRLDRREVRRDQSLRRGQRRLGLVRAVPLATPLACDRVEVNALYNGRHLFGERERRETGGCAVEWRAREARGVRRFGKHNTTIAF
mgnify:CR=1 FL=1